MLSHGWCGRERGGAGVVSMGPVGSVCRVLLVSDGAVRAVYYGGLVQGLHDRLEDYQICSLIIFPYAFIHVSPRGNHSSRNGDCSVSINSVPLCQSLFTLFAWHRSPGECVCLM